MFEILLGAFVVVFYTASFIVAFYVLLEIDGLRSFKLPSTIIIWWEPNDPLSSIHYDFTLHGVLGSLMTPLIGLATIVIYAWSPVPINPLAFWATNLLFMFYPLVNNYWLYKWGKSGNKRAYMRTLPTDE